MTPITKRIDDLATLRAFAHPLRMRLLGTLRVDGPSTASELGRRWRDQWLDQLHLRQLARYGFIEEDPDQPSRRERRWRATTDYTSWDSADFLADDASRAALHVFERAHRPRGPAPAAVVRRAGTGPGLGLRGGRRRHAVAVAGRGP